MFCLLKLGSEEMVILDSGLEEDKRQWQGITSVKFLLELHMSVSDGVR